MIYNNHYLNKLYDLVTNSPKTISMNIPSDIGQGKIVQTKIKHGIVLSNWQMCYKSDMNVQGPVSKEYMQIIFCLNDGISWGVWMNGALLRFRRMSLASMPCMEEQNIFITKRIVTFPSRVKIRYRALPFSWIGEYPERFHQFPALKQSVCLPLIFLLQLPVKAHLFFLLEINCFLNSL